MRKLCLLMLMLVFTGASVAAQSLAEVAKKERERQAKIKAEQKTPRGQKPALGSLVITEQDLGSMGGNMTSSRGTGYNPMPGYASAGLPLRRSGPPDMSASTGACKTGPYIPLIYTPSVPIIRYHYVPMYVPTPTIILRR